MTDEVKLLEKLKELNIKKDEIFLLINKSYKHQRHYCRIIDCGSELKFQYTDIKHSNKNLNEINVCFDFETSNLHLHFALSEDWHYIEKIKKWTETYEVSLQLYDDDDSDIKEALIEINVDSTMSNYEKKLLFDEKYKEWLDYTIIKKVKKIDENWR